MTDFLHVSLIELINAVGYAGIFGIVFAESGLPFGFIFPGDSLLFIAGVLASAGYFDIRLLTILITCAAILGDSAGYWIGGKIGPLLFTKEDSFLFNKKYIERAERFYEKHGPRALILARFIPVVRSFVPILAGVGRMPYLKFLSYNVIGGVLWGAGLPLLGFYLGNAVPNIEHYLITGILVIIALSLIPIIFELLKKRTPTASGPDS